MRRSTEDIDYAAEWARTRRAQGLPLEIPEHQWEAIEALLIGAEASRIISDDRRGPT
jgi:hypothetical protein